MNRGSPPRCGHSRGRSPGFNEAPIHESGKCERSSPRRSRIALASMRPRFMNRGSHHAENKANQKADASMRPRFMNRGSSASIDRAGRRSPASMRPRFMNRGSSEVEDHPGIGVLASMRPRFMNRGSRRDRGRGPREHPGFNEAPIHESGKLRAGDVAPFLVGVLQ